MVRLILLWDNVKDHAYTDQTSSIEALEYNIEAFIHEVAAEIVELNHIFQSLLS